MKTSSVCILTVALAALVLPSHLSTAADKTRIVASNDASNITITRVPSDPPGEQMASKPIEGEVTGINPAEVKVIVYALGDTWYVQPWDAKPSTAVNADSKWSSSTHGGFDFAALLVKPTYRPKATLAELPKVGGDVLAIARKKPDE